jgi:hypothetical protein
MTSAKKPNHSPTREAWAAGRLFVLLAGVCGGLTAGRASADENPAPVSLTVRDLAGAEHSAAESQAKATVWLFIAHDCPISNGYAPEIRRIVEAYAPCGVCVNLVYAESGLDLAALRQHARDHDFHAALFYEDGSRLPRVFGVTTTPEAAVVDAKGRMVYRGRIDDRFVSLGHERSEVSVHDLRDALDAILLGRPVATPRTHAIGCALSPAN